jgi:hypothetical protein
LELLFWSLTQACRLWVLGYPKDEAEFNKDWATNIIPAIQAVRESPRMGDMGVDLCTPYT